MTWEVAPRIFSWTSPWNPVMRAMAMTRAATPMAMPATEIRVMTEMKACFLLAVRYRRATNSSKLMGLFRPQEGEENDLPDRLPVGQDHRQPVDADALPARRRQSVVEGLEIVHVGDVGLLVPPAPLR